MSALDRDAARKVLLAHRRRRLGEEQTLDALEGCVRPAPAHTIERNKLARVIADLRAEEVRGKALRPDQEWADQILALLLVDGVTLTRDEAALAARAMRWIIEYAPGNVRDNTHAADLTERLEAAL